MTKLKTVEEVTDLLKVKLPALVSDADIIAEVTNTLTQDRQSLHTSLVEAVEGMYQVWTPDDKAFMEHGTTERLDNEYNQALDDTLTIINSIFKE